MSEGIHSPFNACCYRDKCKQVEQQRDELLAALEQFMELDPNFNAANNDTLIFLSEDKTSRSKKMAVAVLAARRAIAKAKGGAA